MPQQARPMLLRLQLLLQHKQVTLPQAQLPPLVLLRQQLRKQALLPVLPLMQRAIVIKQ
jgi:hypothetical protein